MRFLQIKLFHFYTAPHKSLPLSHLRTFILSHTSTAGPADTSFAGNQVDSKQYEMTPFQGPADLADHLRATRASSHLLTCVALRAKRVLTPAPLDLPDARFHSVQRPTSNLGHVRKKLI